MMTFLSYLLASLLILDSLMLTLLVLVQLPKKEAGAGMAFGGGAADALFGAGSGNTLTKLTRNCAVVFFVLVILLSMINNGAKPSNGQNLKRALDNTPAASQPAAAPPTSISASTNAASGPALTIGSSNAAAPAAPATNQPPK